MAETVSYADLQGGFARSPPERSHWEEPSEGELTYENIQSSRAQDEIPRASKGATGCCPQGWKLFRWKCLRVSLTEARWEDSKAACQYASSQLLVLHKPWEAADVWDAGSPEQSNHYWIGLKKSQNGFLWVDQTHSLENYSVRAEGGRHRKDCVDLHEGTLNWCPCYLRKRYICEKPASPWPVDGGP
ncbi:CD209 antigen-like protein 2 [Python bivittatus]|uniref:CD209 antigen-like protein 2 n=1 Tax=Python bivittatus TaxID=176946 RepID=A0A9F5N0R3_PYTBI|nr:CD209 antigen-like protein 2 [Python bivittatus]